MSSQDLFKLKSVSPNIAATLAGLGIRTVETLAFEKLERLVDAGIQEAQAKKILEDAWLTLGYGFKTADKLLEERKKIVRLTTGSPAIDKILGGGIETGTISEIVGDYASGKTNMCFTICVCRLKDHPDESILFIDTEGTFSPERITEIAINRGAEKPEEILKRIVHVEVLNSDHYQWVIDHLDQQIKTRNIKAIIIDSLLATLRAEYTGRELLSERQQILNKMLWKLRRIAETFNIAPILTNQVLANPSGTLSQDPVVLHPPIGGHILSHSANTRLYLRKAETSTIPNLRIARLIDSNWRPWAEVTFKITEKGIE